MIAHIIIGYALHVGRMKHQTFRQRRRYRKGNRCLPRLDKIGTLISALAVGGSIFAAAAIGRGGDAAGLSLTIRGAGAEKAAIGCLRSFKIALAVLSDATH